MLIMVSFAASSRLSPMQASDLCPLQCYVMLQVFEAYCLVVLQVSGPVARPVPAGQLAAAADAFCTTVVAPVNALRMQLQAALAAAGLLPVGQMVTQPADGHLLLFDVVVPGE